MRRGAGGGSRSGSDTGTAPRATTLDIATYANQQQQRQGRYESHVQRGVIDIRSLDRIEETLDVRPPNRRVRPTHSADIKRCYTPLWEKYKRSLIFPPEMSEEERDLVRRLRQDPFARRSYAPKIHNLEESIAGTQWRNSARVMRQKESDEDAPRSTSSPRVLKTQHRGIQVQPVGKMQDDISFRTLQRTPSPSPAASPRRESSGVALPDRRVISLTTCLTATAALSHLTRGMSPTKPGGSPTGNGRIKSQTDRHQAGGVGRGGGRAWAAEAELQHAVATFNELKRRAVLLDRIPPSTEMLTPEMFVRIEDDFLRATNGRKSRMLMPGDFTNEIKLGGNIFTRRRLEFLLSKENGAGVPFVPLFQYAFPYVSSAQIDRYMLQFSTSMNVLLGGPLEVRAEPAVYRAIQSFYSKFDGDGDGVVFVQDIVRQQKKLHESANPTVVTHAPASVANSGERGDAPNSAPAAGEGFEAASHHIHAEPDGSVTLESFAIFSRFLFPPYKALENRE